MHTFFPEKMIFGGQALAHDAEGKAAMLWNALPGEEVVAAQVHKRKGVIEAWAEEVPKSNAHRLSPVESHWGSCSPWQIMDYAYENEQKLAMGRETYRHIGGLECPELTISSPKERFGYRNKIEFSFVEDEQGQIQLAFFGRGSKRKVPIDGCALALPIINEAARYMLQWIHQTDLTNRNLKSLIVRATRDGAVIAALLIKDKLPLELPPLPQYLKGLQLVYSTHKSPASVFTEVLQTIGAMELTEKVGGVALSYGIESFFQVYLDIFEEALEAIVAHIPSHPSLLDFYAGAGSIGLALAPRVPQVTLVESNIEATQFAIKNIANNHIQNVTCRAASAENIIELIDSSHSLIVDPPRAGLHAKVVEQILAARPARVVYLSCNISTQARDLQLLGAGYNIDELKLFNFFPATPHIEGLAVLSAKVI